MTKTLPSTATATATGLLLAGEAFAQQGTLPEPGTIALISLGIAGIALVLRRRSQKESRSLTPKKGRHNNQ